MVRMVNALARPRLQGKATRDDCASSRAQGIEHRCLETLRPDIRSKWLTIHKNVNAMGCFISHNLDAALLRLNR
jgi:hypothetical protein